MIKSKLLFEVTEEDRAYVEHACSNSAYTFSDFFSHLLALYKNSLTSTLRAPPIKESEEETQEEVKPKRNKKMSS